MLYDAGLVILGLVGLFVGGEWLVRSAARLARSFGVSSLVIGLTVVAFGTSVPELLVSIDAALRGSSDIALGNVIGSNIANIGLILGLTGLIAPIAVDWSLIKREIPLMIAISFAVYLLALDGEISALDGLIMGVGFIAFNAYSYLAAKADRREISHELNEFQELEGLKGKVNRLQELGRLVIAIALLMLGAQWTVTGAVSIARSFGVSELIIGITLVAFGTSLPELATSIMAALRRESDIAIGNVIGSNIANLLAILGITAIVRPIPVAPGLLAFELLVMIGFAALLLPFVFRRVLRRPSAVFLFAGYAGFIALSFLR
jgi:cation:H+ antiporter